MKVLVACEFSGRVRDAFTKLGHDAMSCDLLPSETPGKHFQGDVREVLNDGWDLMIAHPPCTYLSRAGARWWNNEDRKILANEAVEFVFLLRDAPIEKIVIENPIGQLNKRWRYPDQTIHLYMFGEPYSKATCLWLKNLPLLKPTEVLDEYQPWIAANTSRRKKLGVSYGADRRGKDRSKTFLGIANAMAQQWGTKPLSGEEE